MKYKLIMFVALSGIYTYGCHSAYTQGEPAMGEPEPIHVNLSDYEAVMIVQKGGVTNTDTVQRIVKSLRENNPGLNLVQDQSLASELSSWLDNPDSANLPAYLERPAVKQKVNLHNLRYMLVVERDRWGVEGQIWDFKNRNSAGIISSRAPASSYVYDCPEYATDWIIGLLIVATAMVSGGGPDIQVPCRKAYSVSSNPDIDTMQLGIHLGRKLNRSAMLPDN